MLWLLSFLYGFSGKEARWDWISVTGWRRIYGLLPYLFIRGVKFWDMVLTIVFWLLVWIGWCPFCLVWLNSEYIYWFICSSLTSWWWWTSRLVSSRVVPIVDSKSRLMLLQQRNSATMISYLLLLLDVTTAILCYRFPKSGNCHLHVFTAGTFTASMYCTRSFTPSVTTYSSLPLIYLTPGDWACSDVLILNSPVLHHSSLRLPPTYTERAL